MSAEIDYPKWLRDLLEQAAKSIECVPDLCEWEVGLDTGENTWHASLWAAPTLVGGEIAYPEVMISIGDIMNLFDRVKYTMWHGECPSWNAHIEINGLVAGNDLTIEIYAQAPDDVPAKTKLLPDGSWGALS